MGSNNFDIDENLLDENFSVIEFSNGLLQSFSSNELEFQLPLKRLNYDISEYEDKIELLLRSNSIDFINQFYKKKNVNSIIQKELDLSLNYLDISYNRLNDDIIKKYEKIKKLQNILNKIHQTSNLLRDSLIFLHLINKMKKIKLSFNSILELSIIQSQLNYILSNNVNLITLKIIKTLKNDVLVKNEKELISFATLNIIKIFNTTTTEVDFSTSSTLATLIQALSLVSKNDFVAIINKILQVLTTSTTQSLSKSINSIKGLPILFDETILPNAKKVYQLQHLLKSIQMENSINNLFIEYINLQKSATSNSSTSTSIYASRKTDRSLIDIFWSSLSNSYKKNFEITINRGGPVGKALVTNKQLIFDTFNQKMSQDLSIDNANTINFKNNIDTMLNSVSILSQK